MNYKLLLLFLSINLQAWESLPPPPPPLITSTPKDKDNEIKTIKYMNYSPGQIKLNSIRLQKLNKEFNRLKIYKKSKRHIKEIIITGFSDNIPISNYQTIWNDLDASIRPSIINEITNQLISKARAIFIQKHINQILDSHLPTSTIIQNISNLDKGGQNRGIKIQIRFMSNFGLKKIPNKIRKLP